MFAPRHSTIFVFSGCNVNPQSSIRFLNLPVIALPDVSCCNVLSHHHVHLANGTNNSDWMYVYELAMNERLNDWIAGK